MATYCAMFYATRTTKRAHTHAHTPLRCAHGNCREHCCLCLSVCLSVCQSARLPLCLLSPSVRLASCSVCLSDCPFVAPVCAYLPPPLSPSTTHNLTSPQFLALQTPAPSQLLVLPSGHAVRAWRAFCCKLPVKISDMSANGRQPDGLRREAALAEGGKDR